MNEKEFFVNPKIWNLFCDRFKSSITQASYWSDIQEFCRFTGKAFDKASPADVKAYYDHMQECIERGKISSLTLTKKFREMHSFAEFLIQYERENNDQGGSPAGMGDPFYPYLKTMKKEEKLARSVPVEDMDALLSAASDDLMAYTILTLMYRAGLSSTEITELTGEDDFVIYDDGGYAMLRGRRELCHIPADAWEILTEYMAQRERHPSLFYNRSGRPLNKMYISRMMKKYCAKAGVQGYSAEAVRNSCAFNMFAYGASAVEVAEQMGRTELQIKRYKGVSYRGNLRRRANDLVKMHIEKP